MLERTKVIGLGKETETRTANQKVIETVLILLDCRWEAERTVLEDMLRGAGRFPTYHGPRECLDFVKTVREEVRKMGY